MRLRVASLNVWALPWPLSREVPARMRAIGGALAGLALDVAAFQEVWTADAAQTLLDSGRRAGLRFAWRNERRGGSGLLVLSRRPLSGASFEPYAVRGRPERIWHGDYYGGKGFAALRLETEPGPLVLVVTHLHSQYADDARDDYRAHRMAQVVQLAARLAPVGAPLVAAGDFNLRPDQPTYTVLTGLARLRDAAAEAGAPAPTSLASNPYRSARVRSDTRIDYVFVRDGGEAGIRVARCERIFDTPLELDGRAAAWSDHAGVLAELELTARSSAPAPPDPAARELARETLAAGGAEAAARRGRQRAAAGTAVVAAALGAGSARLRPIGRRGALRAGLFGGASLALLSGLGLAALSELHGPDELRAFRETAMLLDTL